MARGFGSTYGTGATDSVKTVETVNVASKFSFAGWILINGSGGATFGGVMCIEDPSFAPQTVITMNGSTSQLALQRDWTTTPGYWHWTAPATGRWRHLVVTYDGSSTANNPVVYIDGVSQTVTKDATPAGSLSTINYKIWFGNGDDGSTGSNIWDGMLEGLAFYNGYILTPAEAFTLAMGESPKLVRPDMLTVFAALDGVNNPEPAWPANFSPLTVTGTKLAPTCPPAFDRVAWLDLFDMAMDALPSGIPLAVSESVSFSVALANAVGKNISITLATAVVLGNAFTLHPFTDGFTTTETSFVKSIGKNVAETLATSVALVKDMSKALSESWATAGVLGKAITLAPFNDSFHISESYFPTFNLFFGESMSTAESFARVVSYHLALSGGWSTAEAVAKSYSLKRAETLEFFAEFRRRANGIISDMILMNTALTPATFENAVDSGHPPGFENFRDFLQGNYDYTDALFRVIMESTTTDRAALSSLSVTVDTPDILDGGEAIITNASTGVDIVFNRLFHVAPVDINLTLKGGSSTGLSPQYSSVTTTGLNAKLYDSTGTLQTGTVSWSIRGR